MWQAPAAMVFAALRRFGGAVLFRGWRTSSKHGRSAAWTTVNFSCCWRTAPGALPTLASSQNQSFNSRTVS